MYSRDDFILCDNCSAVYCASCYTKLKEKHSCKNCKSQLLNKPLKILLTDPSHIKTKLEIEISSEWTGISAKSYRDGLEVPGTDTAKFTNVADVIATVKGLISYETPWSKGGNKTAPEVNPFAFVFHNVAVKIGEKWYLMSAVPGDFSDQ